MNKIECEWTICYLFSSGIFYCIDSYNLYNKLIRTSCIVVVVNKRQALFPYIVSFDSIGGSIAGFKSWAVIIFKPASNQQFFYIFSYIYIVVIFYIYLLFILYFNFLLFLASSFFNLSSSRQNWFFTSVY